MSIRTALALGALTFSLAACASQPDKTAGPVIPSTGEKLAKADVICRTEYVVGSHRPEKICTTRAMREEMKRNADMALDPIRKQPTYCGDAPCQ